MKRLYLVGNGEGVFFFGSCTNLDQRLEVAKQRQSEQSRVGELELVNLFTRPCISCTSRSTTLGIPCDKLDVTRIIGDRVEKDNIYVNQYIGMPTKPACK